MAEKIIINNCTDRNMYEVLFYVAKIIENGRISNNEKAYCYMTSFSNDLLIVAKRNKNSDTFIVLEEPLPKIPLY